MQFTRRLLDENPRGVKGLAYVLMEIRRAISEGIVKPKINPNSKKSGGGINKFAAMFNKAASTRLHQTEKLVELEGALKEETNRILDHLVKQQNFSND